MQRLVMKIGVLSDTHLTRVTQDLERLVEAHFREVDLVIHAGDMVGLPVYRYLQHLPLEAVTGNMDEAALRDELPGKKTLTVGAVTIGLMHGWGSPVGLEERLRREFSGVDIIVYGHSHLPVNHRSGGILFFNPGSASGFRHEPTIGLLHLEDGIRGEIIKL